MGQPSTDQHRMIVLWAFAKLDVAGMVAASAAVAAAILSGVTLWLVVKGAPPGVPVGPHLGRLAQYFPGFTVSAPGAAVGAAYAAIVGGAVGLALAVLWNAVHRLALAVIRFRARLASYSLD